MRPLAFATPGRFWRGNLHTHSDRSDGALAPEEVCRRYAAAGYDFLCLSDHFLGRYGYPITDTAACRTAAFTTIPGAEVHSGRLANGELWHLLAVGLPADFAPPDSPDFAALDGQESAAALAERAAAAGAFVAIAHPEWYGLTPGDALAIEAAHAVEVHNHGCHTGCDRGGDGGLLDHLVSAGRRIGAIAVDDAHFHPGEPDHFGGWVMVKAEENAPEALVAALRRGAYYASCGPEIRDIRIEDGCIHVACSPAARVTAVGLRTAAASAARPGMTSAALPLSGFEAGGWFRVTVTDAAGMQAWSGPVWLEEAA